MPTLECYWEAQIGIQMTLCKCTIQVLFVLLIHRRIMYNDCYFTDLCTYFQLEDEDLDLIRN